MKKFFVCVSLIALLSSVVFAADQNSAAVGFKIKNKFALQNLIGEIISIDQTSGKIVIQTDAKLSVTVVFSDKTAFRRVAPGETSLSNAETIKITDLKVGDRVLVPNWNSADEQAAVRQIIVMARAAIEQTRTAEQEKRRARTLGGRITAINAEKKEITIQSRGRGNPETLIVDASGKAKLLRYAPDSLKLSDAVPGAFADLRIGDQIRVIGDRSSSDAARVTAEEIIFGSVARTVGTISEINAARGEVVIKNNQSGQTITVAIGKNTTLRRITPEVAADLRERFERRARRQERNTAKTDGQTNQPQNRERRRERNADGQNNNRRQLFENLPAITVSDLKKGDAVLITGTNAASATQMTAVSIIAGDGDLQQILLRTQGGRDGNMSPGLPGNVSGGNAAGDDDDEPER